MSDLALRSRIVEALAAAPHVDVAEIAVERHDDGGVVLRGSIVNLLQRAEAVRTARGVPGVRSVDDQLRTRPVGAEHRTAAETEAAVLDALILDDAVPAYGIDVDVDVDVDVDGGKVVACGPASPPSWHGSTCRFESMSRPSGFLPRSRRVRTSSLPKR